jgi:hypothetical protein
MSDLKKLTIPLTTEEMSALQNLAKKDCRLDYEQVRFVLRNYLVWAGELPKAETSESYPLSLLDQPVIVQ